MSLPVGLPLLRVTHLDGGVIILDDIFRDGEKWDIGTKPSQWLSPGEEVVLSYTTEVLKSLIQGSIRKYSDMGLISYQIEGFGPPPAGVVTVVEVTDMPVFPGKYIVPADVRYVEVVRNYSGALPRLAIQLTDLPVGESVTLTVTGPVGGIEVYDSTGSAIVGATRNSIFASRDGAGDWWIANLS